MPIFKEKRTPVVFVQASKHQHAVCPSCEEKATLVMIVGDNANEYSICHACADRFYVKNRRFEVHFRQPDKKAVKPQKAKSVASGRGSEWYRMGRVVYPRIRSSRAPIMSAIRNLGAQG